MIKKSFMLNQDALMHRAVKTRSTTETCVRGPISVEIASVFWLSYLIYFYLLASKYKINK